MILFPKKQRIRRKIPEAQELISQINELLENALKS